jgi:hypothetical protein
MQLTAIIALIAALISGFLTHRYDVARYERAIADQQREAAEMLLASAQEHGKQVAENADIVDTMEANHEQSLDQLDEAYSVNRALADRVAASVRLRVPDRKGCQGGVPASHPDPQGSDGAQALSGLLVAGDQEIIGGLLSALNDHDRRGDQADAVAATCRDWAIRQETEYAKRNQRAP